jgi:flavin reductase (DIM6/NTAB) family NADH-FMN oxidoreductase RutF
MQEPSPFARFARSLDYPLYIVTTAVQAERSGCLIGFATQCSIRPPRFLACLSKKNHTFELAQRAAVLAVHRVDEGRKQLAGLFGGETGDEVDKFALKCRLSRVTTSVDALLALRCWCMTCSLPQAGKRPARPLRMKKPGVCHVAFT